MVPLDYAHPAGANVHIAMIRHRATDPAHRIGSVFFNPGGPGGSGVDLLPALYPAFPPQVRARFDVVSFDPRGIGASTPLQCFDSPAAEQNYLAGLPPIAPTAPSEQRAWIDRYAGFDAHCREHAGPLLNHDSTADVARDMDQMRSAVGDPTMNYLGTSYGSYLGTTYANLFPQRVRAVVVDGNIDAVAQQRPDPVLPLYMRIKLDVGGAQTINAFLDLCGRAGPKSCAFAAGSAAATHAKYQQLLDRLRTHPVTLGTGQTKTTFTEILAVTAFSEFLYTVHPISVLGLPGWVGAAQFLQQLWDGGGTSPAAIPRSALTRASGAAPGEGDPVSELVSPDTELGVVCSESPEPHDPTAYIKATAVGTRRAGDVAYQWIWPFEACAHWPGHATQAYNGPWNRPTAHPLLVIGNTVDPGTPYQGSVALQRELAHARLLTVDGYGHTSLFTRSTCALTVEDRYFVNGTLPPPGTRCRQDAPPF